MSTSKRKLGFYCLEMKYYRRKKEVSFFNMDLFIEFLKYLNTDVLPQAKMKKNEETNKSIGLDLFEEYEKNNRKFIKIAFKSCKFHHSPNYISSDDGGERESDKKPNEGEKELTHLLCMEGNNELVIILEERRSGVSITSIVKYFNNFLSLFFEKEKVEDNKKIILTYSRVPVDNLEESIESLTRICSSQIFTHKKLLGSSALGFLNESDSCMKDEIVISCSVKRGESLMKRTGKKLYELAISDGEKIERVRIKGKDINDADTIIDTYFTKRKANVEVPVDELKGIVNTKIIFEEMEKLLLREI